MKKTVLAISAILALSTSVFAGTPMKNKDIESLKTQFPTTLGAPGINILKAEDQGKFKQLKVEVMTPRGPQRFDVFSVKGTDTLFVGQAINKAGAPYSLTVDKKVISEGALMKYGKGKEQVYLVTDPECPYCQRLESMMDPKVGEKYTVNIIPFPLSFHKNSKPMLYYVLSATSGDEQVKRMHAVMTGDKAWESFKPTDDQIKSAEAKIAKSLAAGNELGAGGTPSVFNGKFEKAPTEILVNPELLKAPQTPPSK